MDNYYTRRIKKILSMVRFDNYQINFITITQVMAVLYFYNPLTNVKLESWNRTFCEAVLAGISIDKRINHFYILVMVLFPLSFLLFNLINNMYLKNSTIVKNAFRLNIPLFIITLIMYLLRFTEAISDNIKIIIMICIVCLHVGIVILGGKALLSYGNQPRDTICTKKESISFKNAFINCYLVLTIAYFVYPLSAPSSQEFSSTKEYILYGIIKNHKFIFDLGLFALVCLLGMIIMYHMNNRYFKKNNQLANILYWLGWASFLPIISAYVYRFVGKPLSELGISLLSSSYNSATDDVSAQMLLVSGIIIYVIVAYLVNKLNSVLIKNSYGTIFQYIYGTILLNIFINNYFVSNSIILVLFFVKEVCVKKKVNIVAESYLISGLYWLPMVYAIVISMLFWLNEKGIYIKNYLSVVSFSLIIFELIIYEVTKGKSDKKKITVYNYIGGIISIICIKFFMAEYPIVFDFQNYANVYELANKTVAADTLCFGKLPVVDYFSAHALGDVLDRLIYSIIHTDYMGIFAGSYMLLDIIGVLALLYILAQIMPLDFTVVSLSLLPLKVSGLKSYSFCLIVVAALCYIYKKKTLKSFFIFWICALFSAFYMYDEGVYLGIACIITFLIVLLVNHDKKAIYKFIFSGAIIGLITLFLLSIHCINYDIDGLSRIKEWLSVGMGSNSSWATEKFAKYSSISFLFAYFIVPCSAMGILIVALSKLFRKENLKIINILIIIFAITEMLFIPRTIIYHNWSVCRGRTGTLMNYWPWTISLFVLCLANEKMMEKSKQLISWTASLVLCILCEFFLATFLVPSNTSSIVAEAANTSNEYSLSADMSHIWGKERIVETEATSEFYGNFKEIFDLLLEDGETFLDFANITSLYAYTNRIRPFYVAQSPSLLTDLYSQECYLKEISNYKIPLAITGNTDEPFIRLMTDIPHNIRYYKIAEYIYSTYRPIARVGDFTVWCDKNTYLEYVSVLKNSDLSYEILDYGYDSGTNSHSYDIKEVPYLWANMDDYDAIENDEICLLNESKEGNYDFEGSQYVNTEKGNYLLFSCINNQNDQCVLEVVLKAKDNPLISYKYSMFVKPGENNYLLRVSQDYFWTAFNINSVSFSSEDILDFDIASVKILEGD